MLFGFCKMENRSHQLPIFEPSVIMKKDMSCHSCQDGALLCEAQAVVMPSCKVAANFKIMFAVYAVGLYI